MKKINFVNQTSYDLSNFQKKICQTLETAAKADFNLNIIFVSQEEIKKINYRYRGRNSITDVISFANCDILNPIINPHNDLGDIFICYERAVEQSQNYGHSIMREIVFLSIHGYLHLLGYDHQTVKDEKIMFEMQNQILENAELSRK